MYGMTVGTRSVVGVVALLASSVAFAEDAGIKKSASVNLGISMTGGNSTTLVANACAVGEITDGKNTGKAGVEWNYGEQGDDATVDNSKGFVNLRHIIRDGFYAYYDTALSRDKIADVTYRLITGPGLGYSVYKTEQTDLAGEGGLSYIGEKVGDKKSDILAVRLAERLNHQFSKTSKLWETVEYLPDTRDWKKKYLVNGEAGIEAAIREEVALRLMYRDTYDSQPAPGRKNNDTALIASVSYKL